MIIFVVEGGVSWLGMECSCMSGAREEVMQGHDHTIAMQFYTGGDLTMFCCCLDPLQVCEYDDMVRRCTTELQLHHCGWTRRDSTLSVSLSPADINTAAPPPAPAARGTQQQ